MKTRLELKSMSTKALEDLFARLNDTLGGEDATTLVDLVMERIADILTDREDYRIDQPDSPSLTFDHYEAR